MIVDSSAIVAIALRERGYESLITKLGSAKFIGIGAPTLVETGLVLSAKLKDNANILLARFVQVLDAKIVPFGTDHYQLAIDGYRRFGKGRHPAGLNFGDCMTYAVAKLAMMPLLYIGDDFSKTDLPSA